MSQNKMPDIPLDFVTNDYNGYFELMKEAIPILTPEWTDTSDTDQGIVILQLLSYSLHILGYYQERAMQENILELARTKKGVLTGSRFLGYSPERQTASVALLKIVKDSDYLQRSEVVPKGSQFSTDVENGEPIIFETKEKLEIGVGESFGTVLAVQGETIEEEHLGISDGKPNQRYVIEVPDVLVDTLKIYTIENGVTRNWTKKSYFLESKPNDRHYTIDLDEEDRTIVKFGDGILGMKPPAEVNVYANYRHGGGSLGDLAPNMITYVYDTDNDLSFIESVTNEEASEGGSDYEDMEVTKAKAPKHYRSRGQAVTPLDFEDIAELFPGVYKAKSVESFDNLTGKMYLYLLTTNYTAASSVLCAAVKENLDKNRVGNVNLEVLPCVITDFNIKCTIYVHDGFEVEAVRLSVKKELEGTFNVSKFDYEEPFYASKVIEVAFKTEGVKNVVLDSVVTVDITEVEKFEILKLKDVTVELGV